MLKRLIGEWQEEFVEGCDYVVVSGKELAEIKALLKDGTKFVPSFSNRVTLLFEPGLYLALTKTNKPLGRKLRRFVVDQVLPQIARSGNYLPERAVKGEKSLEDRTEMRKLELEEARFRYEAMVSLVETLENASYISDDIVASYKVACVEEATGRQFSALKPPANEELFWESPTQIAKRLNTTTARIGLIISDIPAFVRGSRRSVPGLARAIINKSPGGKTVPSCLYSPEAVRQIEDNFRDWAEKNPKKAKKRG